MYLKSNYMYHCYSSKDRSSRSRYNYKPSFSHSTSKSLEECRKRDKEYLAILSKRDNKNYKNVCELHKSDNTGKNLFPMHEVRKCSNGKYYVIK